MQAPVGQIASKIFAKVGTKKERSNYVMELHDALMAEYGWIPFEEFKNLPIQTAFNLLEMAQRRHKKEEKQMKKKSPRRR
jgi:protein involved in temperature-dependent protein secretion